MRRDPKHRAGAVAAHLMYGNRYDPHAAVCSCGWHGNVQPDRAHAEADAEHHERTRAPAGES